MLRQRGQDMTVSDEVRKLSAQGLTVAAIAKRLCIRYQHAYAVLNPQPSRGCAQVSGLANVPLNLIDAVALVACVSQKQTVSTQASQLYQSDWFIKARTLVEASTAEWYILSAFHGLVAPTAEIAPYEMTLNTAGIAERRAWAEFVHAQLDAVLTRPRRIVMFAGKRYRECLEPALRQDGHIVEVPMQGLRIGEQLAWLGMHA
jgi:cytoplasmic iron level regulating protein YaaA (DUF328/UPF0246 family)